MGIKDLPSIINGDKSGHSLNYYIHIAELAGKRIWVDVNAIFFSHWNKIARDYCESTDRLMEVGVDYDAIVTRWKSMVVRVTSDWVSAKVDLTLVLDGEAPDSKDTTRAQRRLARDDYRQKAAAATQRVCELLGVPYEEGTYVSGPLPPIPLEKAAEVEQLRSAHRDALKCYIDPIRENWLDLLSALQAEGMRCVRSSVEAETLCCKAVIDGKADYVLSSDSDCLAYRIPVWLRGWESTMRSFKAVSLDAVIAAIGIPPERFTDFCIMCGCDYNQRISHNKAGKTIRMGPVTAAKLLKERSLDQIMRDDTSIEWDLLNVDFCRSIFNLKIEATEVSLAESSDCIQV
jgi:5'-3' exonuclease